MDHAQTVASKALASIHRVVTANRLAGDMITKALNDPAKDSVVMSREDAEALRDQLFYSAHIMTTLATHQAEMDDKLDELIKKFTE